MIRVTLMGKDDIPFCKSLTDREGWGYRISDYERLIDHEPEGCFVAWEGAERTGMITTTSYGDYAFLGTLIVEGAGRGRGTGTVLLTHAIEYLEKKGVLTIELDGVFSASSLYRRLGFRDKYLSLRFRREPGKADESPRTPLRQKAAREIPSFDRRMTGLEREGLVRRLLSDFPDSVYVAGEENISGYAVVREREGGSYAIGPFVAGSPPIARSLMAEILLKYGDKPLAMGVPATNRDMVGILLAEGFLYNPPSLRMYRGARRDYEEHVYGILSPEKG